MKKSIMISILAVMLTMAGCSIASPVQLNPTAGPDLAATADVLRTAVASTVVAAVTSTAEAIPTNTPIPTETPVPDTATPTATVVTPTAPPTVIPTLKIVTLAPSFTNTPGPYSCAITKQALKWGQTVPPGAELDGRWTVKNIGKHDWDTGTLKYEYSGGSKLYAYKDSYAINKGVDTGDSIEIIVDLNVPKEPGYYHMEWVLSSDEHTLCTLPVDIRVSQ